MEISGAGQNNYTLMQADVGATMSVNVTFEDAYGFSEAISSASSAVVTNVNDAPRFISETPTDFTVGQTFYYQALANDPDASDSLAFFATGKPEWLTLNSETGELFGLPTSSQLSTSIVTLRVTDELGGESEQSFSLDKTLSSSEFKVIHLDDPQSRVEYLGTSADDVAQGYSNTSYFGFEGNDVFNSGSGEEGQGFIGLEGNDTYNINAQGVIIVSDKALSDGDKISATGIAFSSPNTLAFTVENRHLLIGDANSGQEIWIIDWETPENRIETFALSGVQYSYADFNSTVKSFTNFLGDYQWSDIAELTGDTSWNNGPEFDSQIEFYTNFIENSGPEILSQPSLAVAENQHFEYQMVITDPDQNAITTGQAYLMPDWLDFDATSLQLRGTPSNSDVGTHNIILSAHDEFNSLTSQSFVLTVSDSTPPIIESVVANWGSVLNGTEDNSDGTINIVTSNIETGQVVKVGLNGRIYTASIDTAIPADHANPTVSITISAADLQSLSDGGSYSLTADVNDAAGNAAAQHISTSFVVDVTAPTLSTISTDTFSGLSGFTEIGATISVVMTDPSGTDSSLSTTSNATTGAWNITSADILGSEITSDDDGTYAFSITATDTAGNTSNASTASLEVDLPDPIIGGLNINQLSKEGDVVTYGLIADASYDLGGDGIEALDFAINFDPTDLGYIEGSLSSGFDWMLEVPNNTEASSGSVRGGFASNPLAAPFIDFSDPIAEFQMTVLESSEPVNISITGTLFDGDAAPDTIETFSYMSSTLIATVIDRDGTAMDGVTVSTSDNSQTTDDSGQLSFEVSNGSDVVMDASLAFENTSATSAINSMDALQALRIAVGLDTSNGPATYENFIAADFDGSGSVNSMDALNILKYAVGLDAPDPHWVFIDSAADHSAITQTSVNYDTGMTLEGFSADASVSLTGILVGDVDDSYSGLIA